MSRTDPEGRALMKEKARMRKEIREAIGNMTPARRRAESESVCARILTLPEWRNAGYILAYFPMEEEVPILSLLSQANREGKTVFLPRVEPPEEGVHSAWTLGGDVLRFHEWKNLSMDELEPDAYNIPVPRIQDSSPIESMPDYRQSDCLVIVPGLGFTPGGDRLGRGGGFYDQFLESHREMFSVALCFSCQILPALPQDRDDQRVHRVINPQEEKIWDT